MTLKRKLRKKDFIAKRAKKREQNVTGQKFAGGGQKRSSRFSLVKHSINASLVF